MLGTNEKFFVISLLNPSFHYSSFPIFLFLLPPVMGKGLVGLGHLMGILFLLDGSPSVIGRIDQFS